MIEPDPTTAEWMVVVGASAGGVESLRRFVAELPSGLGAAVAIVLHVAPNTPSLLPDILQRVSRLPVVHATDGMAVLPAEVVVAPPDAHLAVGPGRYELRHGATENGVRPAVDVLFRTAATEFGGQCAGVVLSGSRDDGAAGLQAILAAGGVAMVQDPVDAAYPSMPAAALARLGRVDVLGTAGELARSLRDIVGTTRLGESLPPSPEDPDARLLPETYSCPECGGPLEALGGLGQAHFRCHVGHRWSEGSLADRQATQLEQALWTALRIIDERLALTVRMRARARSSDQTHVEAVLNDRLTGLRADAETIRAMLRADPLDERARPVRGAAGR